MSKDFASNHTSRQTIPPAAQTAAANGSTVDRVAEKRAGFEVNVGLYTDGVHTIGFEESDDGSSWADIRTGKLRMPDDAPAGVVVGQTFVIDNVAEDNTNYLATYTGEKRFLRATNAISGETVGCVFGVSVIGGDLRYTGTSQFA